jgi:hypothetical protein
LIYRFGKHFKAPAALFGLAMVVCFGLAADSSIAATRKKEPPALGPNEGWLISQSSNFAGTVLSEFTKDAVRMKVGRLGVVIITKAPTWSTLVYSENNKSYVEMPAGQFMKRFQMGQSNRTHGKNGELLIISKETGKSTKIVGFNAKEYEVRRKASVPTPKRTFEDRITNLWIATDIIAPAAVSQLIYTQLNVPQQNGIPLKVTQKNGDRTISVLETQEIKKTKFSPTIFEPLKGYKKVKDEMQLLMDDGSDDILGGALDTGPTTPPPASLKH